jgi:DNA repair and recombination protein RAD52
MPDHLANKPGSGPNNGRLPPQTPNNVQSLPRGQRPQPAQNQRPQLNNGNAVGPQPAAAAASQTGNPGEPVAFFSAKAVSQVAGSSATGQPPAQFSSASGQHLFNPKADSPSIRKTPGIDHSSSKPLGRNGQHVPPPASQSGSAAPPSNGNGSSFTPVRPPAAGPQAARGSVVNPSLDQARRIGAPSGPGSPLGNRGSYRPLSVKRPPPGDANAQNTTRPPLADVPANQPGPGAANTTSGTDAKRPKLA